jgi:LysM repeat protein
VFLIPFVKETHVIYTVQPGDTLFSIAERFGSTLSLIQQANFLYPPTTDPGLIYAGWTLLVPVPAEQPFRSIYITAPKDTLFQIGHRFSAHVDLLLGINRHIQNQNMIFIGQPLWVPAFVYEVEPGDTLSGLSRRFQIPINHILYANEGRPGFSLDLMYAGYRLIIPMPSSRNIVVTRPISGDMFRNGEQVEGFARSFEANVLTELRDDNGVIVSKERFTTASEGAPAYGYFVTTVPFDRAPTTRGGELWVYARSADDGRIIDLVQVRVYYS